MVLPPVFVFCCIAHAQSDVPFSLTRGVVADVNVGELRIIDAYRVGVQLTFPWQPTNDLMVRSVVFLSPYLASPLFVFGACRNQAPAPEALVFVYRLFFCFLFSFFVFF